MRPYQQILYGAVALVCLVNRMCISQEDPKREFTIFNESGSRVEVNWINPDTNKRILQTTPHIFAGASFNLNSYVGHRFEAKEIPSAKTGNCKNGAEGPSNPKLCGIAFFTVNSNFDQVFYIREGLHIQHDDNHSLALSRASGLLTQCQKDTLAALNDSSVDPTDLVADMSKCIEENLKTELDKSNEESRFQSSVRGEMAELLSEYACADITMAPTNPIRKESWWADRRSRTVNVLHEKKGSQVHIIEDFVTRDECRAMESGVPLLTTNTRAGDPSSFHGARSDGHVPSPNRDGVRISTHDIVVPWEKEANGDLTAKVARRILSYTNHVLQLDIDEHGQEGLVSVQYRKDPVPRNTPSAGRNNHPHNGSERYLPTDKTPNCDEKCRGKPHRVGQRIAMMVINCGVPPNKQPHPDPNSDPNHKYHNDGGGAVNFHKFGAHHIPTQHSAMFVSYMDPRTFRMDPHGYTEHTECPVLKGEKRVVKQWIRHGVHKDNPWDLFEHETAEETMVVMEDDEEL